MKSNLVSFQELFPAIRLYLFLAKEARKRIPLLSGLGHQFSSESIFFKTNNNKKENKNLLNLRAKKKYF
ncbi:hypothetical protein GON26_02450 [Flavobacterium sp. GA093]|uniref:Uncharacterized protein n=1 Tax=Flavobacterium hydrocarbonoxydans TaxID=2683249 RepID=A0A6I4NQ64_9FLAO|nr:hypothetical protein [Flavobacterium hydrocarbonoxydans]MWB93207.1 hypothetical protein [Flavobacterium hydrocarbonoxydans]